jgi:hypothetical protein
MSKEYMTIESNQVFSAESSHIDCVGNCSVYVKMQDGTELEIHRISYRKVDQLVYDLTHPDMSIRIDKSLLTENIDQWLDSVGVTREGR